MSCRVTSTAKNGKYTLVTDYLTDPRRNSVAMETTLKPARGVKNLEVYVRMDATVNGNGGGDSDPRAPECRRRRRGHRHLDRLAGPRVDRYRDVDHRRQS